MQKFSVFRVAMVIYTHIFLPSSPVLSVPGGAGEAKWNAILKEAFITSVKTTFSTADHFPLLPEK